MSCWVRVCFCCLKNRGSIRVSIEYRAWCLLSQSQRSLLLRGGPLRHISSEIVLFFKKQWMLLVKRKGELLVLRSLISMNKQLISCSWRVYRKVKQFLFILVGLKELFFIFLPERSCLDCELDLEVRKISWECILCWDAPLLRNPVTTRIFDQQITIQHLNHLLSIAVLSSI